jgi:hypothetical protein
MEKNKEILKNFILQENKSGYKTKESYFKCNKPDVLLEIKQHCLLHELDSIPFKEQLYLYLNDLKEIPKCHNCIKQLKFGKSFNSGYGIYCSLSCTNKSESHINKSKSTNLRKYGGLSPMSSEKIRDKIKKTNKERYGVENIFEKKEFIQEKINEKYGNPIMTKTDYYKNKMKLKYEYKYESKEIIKNDSDIYYMCPNCDKVSIHDYNTFNYRNRNNIDLCKNCVPPYQSSIESEFENYLIDEGYEFKKHDRKKISPKEIDFYFENEKVGFELHGLYYHSEKFVNPDYHQNKWISAIDNNIQLIQIWEDEWKYKKEMIKEIIKNKLNSPKEKIYARKCEIGFIDNEVYKYFVDTYHLQGYAPAKIKLGLFYNRELVQVMSFSSNRKIMGLSKVDDHYEMIRLCSSMKYQIVGGSNRLLAYFEKAIKPKKIISYCDVRFFSGNTYLNLGFKFIKVTKPNYFYIKPNDLKRYNRFNFRKDRLVKMGFDKDSTEKEIMEKLGYLRVYDAGNKKFEKNYNNT